MKCPNPLLFLVIIVSFLAACAAHEEVGRATFDKGNAALDNGDYDSAIEYFNETLKVKPDSAGAYISRGIAFGSKGNIDQAIADFDQAIKLDPNRAYAYKNRGISYSSKGDFDKAIADFNESIKLDKSNSQAFVERGFAFTKRLTDKISFSSKENRTQDHVRELIKEQQSDYAKAIDDFEQAIKLDPKNIEAYLLLGEIYPLTLDDKGFDKAIDVLTTAINIDPTNIEAYYLRSARYQGKSSSVALDDDFATTKNVSYQYDEADLNNALSDLNHVINLSPDYKDAYLRRGRIYYQKGEFGKAIEDYTRATKINPERAHEISEFIEKLKALETKKTQ
ncbi:MAG: tetratricopeptide repeat protein [Burkholderiales bacterium]|jgi:tetratricopeptide (TPR) repeat protein|nr:tetratricopeptide repeat protein [Burkholderiales bacterium]